MSIIIYYMHSIYFFKNNIYNACYKPTKIPNLPLPPPPPNLIPIRSNPTNQHLNFHLLNKNILIKQTIIWYPSIIIQVIIDLTQNNIKICCKPNRDIFAIVDSFLKNPFFQINQYTCPATPTTFKTSQINLHSIGIIKMSHQITEYPKCEEGLLGLSKQSAFLNYLPINSHTIKIQISSKDTPLNTKIQVSFGNLNIKLDGAWIFPSPDQQYWNINVESIQLDNLLVDTAPNIIFTTVGPPIKMSVTNYQKLSSYFVNSQTCKVGKDNKIICLCQMGIPAFFPKFIINLGQGKQLIVPPQIYMKIDSNICQLVFQSSPTTDWLLNVANFKNTAFYFDRNKAQITIKKNQLPHYQSSQLIQLPIQLILNVAVILLLCIFAALVLIEITKRISGLSQVRQQTIRQYIIRRNIGEQ